MGLVAPNTGKPTSSNSPNDIVLDVVWTDDPLVLEMIALIDVAMTEWAGQALQDTGRVMDLLLDLRALAQGRA